jgi:predicted nucleotidyltransferase
MGFFTFIGLERHLSDLLRAKVDLVTKKALKLPIGQRILAVITYV